jgi:hypothetical protein
MDISSAHLRIIQAGHAFLNIWENNFVKKPPAIVKYHHIRPMIEFVSKNYDIKSDLTGVEIGVAEGDNVIYILSVLPVKKLFLIDPYKEYDDFKGNTGWENITQDKFDEKLKIAQEKLKEYQGKIQFIRKTSKDAGDDIPVNLDFVYIDGNHEYEFAKEDIELYYPKVKTGGVLGGDNFDSIFPGVARAVLEFTDKHGLEIHGARSEVSYEGWVIKK